MISMPARLGAVLCVATLSVVCQAALAEPTKHYLNLRRGTSSVVISDGHLITIEKRLDGTLLWDGTPVTCKQMNARFRSMWSKDKSTVTKAICARPEAIGQDQDQDTPQNKLAD